MWHVVVIINHDGVITVMGPFRNIQKANEYMNDVTSLHEGDFLEVSVHLVETPGL